MTKLTSVLLDRDGTVIFDKHYLADPNGVELLPGAGKGLTLLADTGIRLFLVTNQAGIGRGYFTMEDYKACDEALVRLLDEVGVTLEGGAFCPHAPDDGCECRKPGLGMWHALRDTFDLDAASSAMVGDKIVDIAFGIAAGFASTVLVLTGKGEAEAKAMGLEPLPEGAAYAAVPPGDGVRPHAVARDLEGAARWLLDLGA